nr:MAG TPA: minor capsid protein [Caudoviricetes sp.]
MERDEGRILTDEQLIELEKEIRRAYAAASVELMETIDAHFARFEKKDTEMRRLMEAGQITEDQYLQWRLSYIGRGKRFEELRDKLAERVTRANELAVSYVNNRTPTIYTLNRNYAGYRVEKRTGFRYQSFILLNEAAIRRLLVEKPDLMPNYPKKRALERGIDLAYGKKQITAAVTSGILQGKGVRKIAADLRTRLVNMSIDSAIRTARTAVTAAENGGRYDTFREAEELGIKGKYKWVSTLDARTRPAHQRADGQVRDADKPFIVDGEKLMFPGDKSLGASGWNLYNCRCSYVDVTDEKLDEGPRFRRAIDPKTGKSKIIEDKTYAEWIKEERERDPEALELYFKKTRNLSGDKKLLEKYRGELGKDAPENLAELQKMKYTSPDEWSFFKAFAKERRKGYITSEVSLNKLRGVYAQAAEALVGQKTSNGIEIKSVAVHFASRIIGNPEAGRKGVTIESCVEAITNPVKIKKEKETPGGKSQTFETYGTSVAVNPDTGVVIQANPNHMKKKE